MTDNHEAIEQSGSLISSTALSPQTFSETEVVIISQKPPKEFSVSDLVTAVEELTGKPPLVSSLTQTDTDRKICIFLDELDEPFLSNVNPALFDAVKKLLTTAKDVMWVVRGAYEDSEIPNANMAVGLARTIRSETALNFVTVDLDQRRKLSASDAAKLVAEVFRSTFASSVLSNDCDLEYMERNGTLYVPRIIKDDEMNESLHHEIHESNPDLQPFSQIGRPLRMEIEHKGSFDTLRFTDDNTLATTLPDDHVEIKIEATGLNFKDIMIAMDQLSSEFLGAECSGTITAIGSQVVEFIVGDRVSAISEGTFSNYTRCRTTSLCKIADDTPFETAATIPIVYCTAYYSLIELGRLCRGETVLIHSAAGGVGQAAIMLSQMMGAEIYVTVGSVEKKEFVLKNYNIQEDHVFFSRDTSFGKGIRRATSNKGVDVVLNSLTGDALQATWECLAPFGRFIELGKRDIDCNTRLEMAPFAHNVTFASVDLTAVAAKRPQLMKRLLSDVFDLLRRAMIKPVSPITVFPISDVESAFRSLQSGKNIGKIVVMPRAGDRVKVRRPLSPAFNHRGP